MCAFLYGKRYFNDPFWSGLRAEFRHGVFCSTLMTHWRHPRNKVIPLRKGCNSMAQLPPTGLNCTDCEAMVSETIGGARDLTSCTTLMQVFLTSYVLRRDKFQTFYTTLKWWSSGSGARHSLLKCLHIKICFRKFEIFSIWFAMIIQHCSLLLHLRLWWLCLQLDGTIFVSIWLVIRSYWGSPMPHQ